MLPITKPKTLYIKNVSHNIEELNMITNITTTELNGIKKFRVSFDRDIDLQKDEPKDSLNDCLIDLFSFDIRDYEEVDVQWIDAHTIEVSRRFMP